MQQKCTFSNNACILINAILSGVTSILTLTTIITGLKTSLPKVSWVYLKILICGISKLRAYAFFVAHDK